MTDETGQGNKAWAQSIAVAVMDAVIPSGLQTLINKKWIWSAWIAVLATGQKSPGC
ncbi:hypothetical protein QMY55_14960 [Comamonas resistens]|uniref:Uncharacterized protein n=1 Tax=Comamonas resistens TaxID=3046670 RepID=A0ABY8SNL1_9BURK|nr:hypothetical protein [Comamonas resistens]WHS63821.1 hypothetical protein QMY55_14960 [Comamonas resistens]